MLQNRHVFLTFDKVYNPLRVPRETTSEPPKVARTWFFFNILTSKCASCHTACTFSSSQLPKVVRRWCFLRILTSKCALRHNGVHSLDISISKSGPSMLCFVHFDFKKVLRATTACAFSTSQLPKVVSGPELRCFLHFVLEMCFAPQRRAIFHLSSGQLAPYPPL